MTRAPGALTALLIWITPKARHRPIPVVPVGSPECDGVRGAHVTPRLPPVAEADATGVAP